MFTRRYYSSLSTSKCHVSIHVLPLLNISCEVHYSFCIVSKSVYRPARSSHVRNEQYTNQWTSHHFSTRFSQSPTTATQMSLNPHVSAQMKPDGEEHKEGGVEIRHRGDPLKQVLRVPVLPSAKRWLGSPPSCGAGPSLQSEIGTITLEQQRTDTRHRGWGSILHVRRQPASFVQPSTPGFLF